MHLLDPEGNKRKLLVSLKDEGFPIVASGQKEIASEGLILTQLSLSGDKHSGVGRDVDPRKRFVPREGEDVLEVIFGMDPTGLARIQLPQDHGMEHFVVRVMVGKVDESGQTSPGAQYDVSTAMADHSDELCCMKKPLPSAHTPVTMPVVFTAKPS